MRFTLPQTEYQCETLVDLLEYRAKTQGITIAYRFLPGEKVEPKEISYQKLAEQSKAIAATLQQQFKAGERALLIYAPGLDLIAAYFGCLYAGIIAVPVYPPLNAKLVEKLQRVVQNAKPAILLTTHELAQKLQQLKLSDYLLSIPALTHLDPEHHQEKLELDLDQEKWITTDKIDLSIAALWQVPGIDSNYLAFLQYTSGSTGHPKGVMVSHGNLLHNLSLIDEHAGKSYIDTIVSWLPPYHDMGLISGILLPLYKGVAGILSSPLSFLQNPFYWLKTITEYTNVLSGAPDFAYAYCIKKITAEQKASLNLSSWKVAFSGAEPIRAETLQHFYEAFKSCGFRQEAFYPCYGLAEATLFVSGAGYQQGYQAHGFSTQELQAHQIKKIDVPHPDAQLLVNCGKLLQEVQIVDPKTYTLCQPRKIGEIWIAVGPSVAQGYWHRPKETQSVFHARLHNGDPSKEYLRTGDLGFVLDDDLYVTGRLKDLIIIHGRNYYPQDIEYTVEHCDARIRGPGACAAFSIEVQEEERLALVCQVSPIKQNAAEGYLALCKIIEASVAECNEIEVYTIALVLPGALPKTTSGKIRRRPTRELLLARQLPAIYVYHLNLPSAEQPATKIKRAARNPTEEKLCQWCVELLGCEVSIDDNLLHLGGHSLFATQLVSQIRDTWEIAFPMQALFQHPTVADLAVEITRLVQQILPAEKSNHEFLPIVVADPTHRFEPFPLTDVQYAYWIGRAGIFELGTVSTHFYFEYDYSHSALDVARLQQAWNKLIQRHEALRIVIDQEGKQRILQTVPDYVIEVVNLKQGSAKVVQQKLQHIREQLSHQVLPADQWPLFKLCVTVFADKIRLHASFDLLILDVWSMELLFAELKSLYHDITYSLPPLTLSFRDYLSAVKKIEFSTRYAQDKAYWLDRLATFPRAPALPLVKLPGQVTKPHFSRCTKTMPRQHWQSLQQKIKTHRLLPSGLLAAVYGDVLASWSKTAHFALNVTLFNRLSLHPQVNEITGDFTSLLALEVKVQEGETFAEYARRLQLQLWQDLDHTLYSGIAFQRELAHYWQQEGVLMPVVFTCILGNDRQLDPSLVETGVAVYAITQTPQVWLDYKVYETAEGLVIEWDYVAELFPENLIPTLHAAYCQELERLHVDSSAWEITERHPLPACERALFQQVNATDWPIHHPLPQELFQLQAKQQPKQIAVISARGDLTYGELQTLSNQLGHRLRGLGAKPNQLIAIIMEKGWEQIVACLAILNAGAAYLPIDPNLPQERIEQLLLQGEATLILTQTDYHPMLTAIPVIQAWPAENVIAVDEKAFSKESTAPLTAVQTLTDLAYVIFTSGSTGQPKGVMIDQRGVVNTILDMNDQYHIKPQDRVLALSNLNFDLSVYDIFGLLAAGGTVVMPPEKELKEPAVWLDWMTRYQVSIWNSVPLFMQMLVEFVHSHKSKIVPLHALRLVLLSGDLIPLNLPAAIQHIFQSKTHALQVISLGGATEASIWSIYYPIESVDPQWKSIPYGKPLRNQRFYVLNDRFKECPVWVEGDLYIAGIGLAQGYWRDENKTQTSFIRHPQTNEKLYRTGDAGRYLPDGNIEFLGRRDFQVKVGGYRIELGEIEYHLQQQAGIQKAVVEAPLQKQNNQRRLVAYVVPQPPAIAMLSDQVAIIDPEQRLTFKFAQHGRRILPVDTVNISLPLDMTTDRVKSYFSRKSYRTFQADRISATPLQQWLAESVNYFKQPVSMSTLADLNEWLAPLAAYVTENSPLPKYRYPSAGSLYPLQVYLELPRNNAFTIPAGYYYYDPIIHRLQLINNKINAVMPAVFRLHLVANYAAIVPLYGSLARDFCLLEAGYMSELLRQDHGVFKQNTGCDTDLTRVCLGLTADYEILLTLSEEKELLLETTPVSALLYIKSDRVSSLVGGWYRYEQGNLQLIKAAADFENMPALDETGVMFYEAAFALFWIGDRKTPRDKKLIECGRVSQSLMEKASRYQLGICAVGAVDSTITDYVAPFIQNSEILHTLIGGAVSDEQMLARETSQLKGHTIFWEQITAALKRHLPDYMIPGAFVMLEKLPLTPNGKLDRKALPLPEYQNEAAYVAPRNEIEIQLAEIWQAVLKVEQIGVNDNFFALGGHSLLATQVISRIRKTWQVEFPIRELFQHPTIIGLANIISQLTPDKINFPLVPVSHEQVLPLSFAQQRLWFLHQLEPENVQYNIPVSLRLEGKINEALLQQAFDQVIQRHEVLRTTFGVIDEKPTQQIATHPSIPFVINDLRKLLKTTRENKARQIVAEQAHARFDLSVGPLIRVGIIHLSARISLLWLVIHHSVADGWSMRILAHELGAYYNGIKLPPLPIQYADYTLWQRHYLTENGPVLTKQLQYWQKQLADAPVLLELPLDKPRPAIQSTAGDRIALTLSPQLTEQLNALARKTNCTLFMVLLTAFAVLLSRYSGQTDLVIGTPIANRQRKEIEGLIGFFVNTLVLRVKLDDNPAFLDLLQRVRRDTLDAYEHQDCPFERLIDHLKIERSLSHTPLFQVMFVLQNTETASVQLNDIKVTIEPLSFKTAKFDLTLSLTEGAEKLSGEFEYSTALFEHATIERLIAHWQTLLTAIVTEPTQPVAILPLLTEKERHQLLIEWNATAKDYPKEKTLSQLFEEQVARTPTNIAVVFGKERLTYQELNARANQLAHYLQSLGVGPDTIVAICLSRSIELIIGLLGILKAGGAYVPLDPNYPIERLEYILNDSQAPVLLRMKQAKVLLSHYTGKTLYLDSEWNKISLAKKENLITKTSPNNLAYVIYTSGSTGNPKGVLIEHQTVINTLFWIIDMFDIKEKSRILQFSSINFDVSVWEIFSSLFSGAILVLASQEDIMPGDNLHRTLVSQKITVASLPPIALSVTDATGLSALKMVVTGGDVCSKQIVKQWSNDRKFINVYGPTETSICATASVLKNNDDFITIGKPMANTTCYLLDYAMQPVPVGAVGELYIGGAGVGRGYLNQPDLTAQRFIENPFATPGDKIKSYTRLYKTGDLARFLPDGRIEFIGRQDFQVKIRGFRIELGEIETSLLKNSHVKEAVVLAREDQPGEKRLVAYVIVKEEIEISNLRDYLKQHLPDYMIPAAFVLLEKFPLTPNGKLDRKALPAPEYQSEAGYVAPRTELDLQLVSIWSEVLKIEPIGITDNFFALGGHSLLATQVTSRIRETWQIEFPIRELFQHSTVAELAEIISNLTPDKNILPLVPVARNQNIPLSFSQYPLWFLDQLEHGSVQFNIPIVLRLEGKIDEALLQTAFNQVIARHDVLRTRFVVVDEQPTQQIAASLAVPLTITDLRKLPKVARESKARYMVEAETHRAFDLGAWPLIRGGIIKLSTHVSLLWLVVHHSVADGWSMGILGRELNAYYRRLELPPLPIQYADYTVWQRLYLAENGPVLTKELQYWQQQLAHAPTLLELPTDKPRPAIQSTAGDRILFTLSATLTEQLNALARKTNCTLFMVLLSAFAVLLSRYSGQTDLVIGSPIANRQRKEIEGLIGYFVNTLAFRIKWTDNPSFLDLLQHVRKNALDAYEHQNIAFDQVVDHLNIERSLSHTRLFQVMFILQNTPEALLRLPAVKVTIEPLNNKTAKFDLTLNVTEEAGKLIGEMEYCTAIFERATIARLIAHWQTLLTAIVAEPTRPVAMLPLMTEKERHQLLVEWNATEKAYPKEKTLPQLFEEQVARTPDNIAVVDGDRQLTYRELNQRANQLAHYLRSLGVKPDTLVAICLPRSIELIVGLLGILKAGGAYMPLDPNYPKERLTFSLNDSNASVLLTQISLLDSFGTISSNILCMDHDQNVMKKQSKKNPVSITAAKDLAYVIYTSGSTGIPKGTLITHQNISHLVDWYRFHFHITANDRFSQFASPAFDVFGCEVWPALTNGSSVCLVDEETKYSTEKLLAWLVEKQITFCDLPTQIAERLFTHEWPEQSALRVLKIGGEKVSAYPVKQYPFTIWNTYGPTETTIEATAYCFNDRLNGLPANDIPPIGRPIYRTMAYILDAALQAVPIGVPGELHLSGAGLARGYLNRPELTAEKFIPDSFSKIPGTRMYKTGDICRFLSDGNIEYIGRVDTQFKIRGFRIELSEIEALLLKHPQIKETAVLAREDEPGEKRLVAYVVVKEKTEITVLRNYLKQHLPDYMVPSAFMILERFPLTQNGKLDRKALPAPQSQSETVFTEPRNAIETQLSDIWKEVLKREQIGVNDNFFALGGHSLLATQVVSRICHNWQVDFPMRNLFQYPTIAELAIRIAKLTPHEDIFPLIPVSREQVLPLSFAQQRLWFLHQLEPENIQYNIPVVLRLEGNVDTDLLQNAFNQVIHRHEVLRTTFVMVGDQPAQCIAARLMIPFTITDLKKSPKALRENKAQQLIETEAHHRFDLSVGPLIRAGIIQLTSRVSLLWLVVHHSVADGWSIGILGRELDAYYRGVELPPLSIQYADYTVWQRHYLAKNSPVLTKQLQYWQKQLADAPALLELPTDKSRPAIQSTEGDRIALTISPILTEQLNALARKTDSTLFMVLLTAFAILLSRYSGQTDLVIGSPIANRQHKEIENLIGFFVNTLALRVNLDGNPTFLDLLQRVRRDTLDAYEHQDCPFEQLIDYLKIERSLSHTPSFQVMFILQNTEQASLQLNDVKMTVEPLHYKTAKFDLTLSLTKDAEKLTGEIEYCTALFERAMIERFITLWQILLAAIVAEPIAQVGRIPLLTEEEQHRLLVEWNATDKDYPGDKTLPQLFEEQVEKTPDAIALIYEDQSLTYRELNNKANQLARSIRKHYQVQTQKTLQPETLIAICVERSLEMIIGILGILKAGGAYVPIDPKYPEERIDYILEDIQTKLLITQQPLIASLPILSSNKRSFIALDEQGYQQEASGNLNVQGQPQHLAYVFYTSGTTGKPKGVMIEHAAISNVIEVLKDVYKFRNSFNKVAAYAAYVFDVSVSEFFISLLNGGQLHILSDETRNDADKVACYIKQQKINFLFLPPAMLSILSRENYPFLQALIFAGEPCDQSTGQYWAERYPLYNYYGPTETTIYSTGTLARKDHINIIGRPLNNMRVYILNSNLQPVPIGIAGELFIGGVGLARGYLNSPELTAERFIENPFATPVDKKMGYTRIYKTGDLVRWLPDGNIEYLGRNDFQVKIRGFRIELGEIETILQKHPHIKKTVVLAREDQLGEKRLVAYIIVKQEIEITALRDYLKQHLPDYMIPAAFVLLEKFPLTPNGKLDRKALPVPEYTATAHYHAPRDALELALTQAWSKVLRKDTIGIQDNFFEVGGHSLLAVQLAHTIRQMLNVEVPIASFFALPTIEKMAEQIRRQDLALFNTPLVAIQPKGTKPAIFAIHPIGGNVLCYAELSKQLGNDQPFYGLQQIKLSSKQVNETLAQMAGEYVEAIRTLQPQGPYHLIGWSLGGVIAHEMAYQLEQRGEAVSLLGLIDSYVPSSFTNIEQIDELDLLVHFARDLGGRYGLEFTLNKEELVKLSANKRLNYLLEKAKFAGAIASAENIGDLEQLIQQYKRNEKAMIRHRLHVVQCSVVYFRANNEAQQQENRNQWMPYTQGIVTVHEIMADHYTILSMPQLQLVTNAIQKVLTLSAGKRTRQSHSE